MRARLLARALAAHSHTSSSYSVTPVKCALNSQAYGTFLLNMGLPLIVPLIAALFLFPMVLISKCVIAKNRAHPIPHYKGKCGIPRRLAIWWCTREAMSEKDIAQYREPVDFLSRLVAVVIFMLFTLCTS